ncbi:hypothetical protein J2Z66_007504 [Paenibacillus eucommiae]|uniref:Uncharacterized protein n=1 Tax=Paenibacillus eucommiae TaxID=1355755 RepID=A0ABS4J7N9_9BACL|nr:hypothetical protein [Paenibacillus eucommiae]
MPGSLLLVEGWTKITANASNTLGSDWIEHRILVDHKG